MTIDRDNLLKIIIEDGVHEVELMYARPEQKVKLAGGIKGFEDCQGKSDEELIKLLEEAKRSERLVKVLSNTVVGKLELGEPAKFAVSEDKYWYTVMYERQIEWTLKVLSAVYKLKGLRPIVTPSDQCLKKARDLLWLSGVQ